MIRHFACVVLFLAGGSGTVFGAGLSHNQLKTIEEFEVSKEPAKRDWQAFHKAAPAFQEALWNYHQKRGIDFARWSWGWRLGWVRACTNHPVGYCQNIFERALADKALVVRAEAATQIGRIYSGTKNAGYSDLLLTAFSNPKNFRAGKPLFVQQRILFALHQIGNEAAARSAAKLSGKNRDLAVYWSRISQTSL